MKLIIYNKTKAVRIGTQVDLASTWLTRLIGLAGRKKLDAGSGLLITPSSGIHTFGMRFPIDVVAIDRELRVLKLWRALPPCRMTSLNLRVHSVLELPVGVIDDSKLCVGDHVWIHYTMRALKREG